MDHDVSRGGPDRAEPNGLGMAVPGCREAGRVRANFWSGGLRHGEVQGLAQEPRIRSRAALIPEVQEKRPVRVGELRSAQTINVIFCRDPMKLQPLKLATKA